MSWSSWVAGFAAGPSLTYAACEASIKRPAIASPGPEPSMSVNEDVESVMMSVDDASSVLGAEGFVGGGGGRALSAG